VTFKLYDASIGGITLSTDMHSVTAANGLFTTSIAVTDPAVVDGRGLWLGIKVGSDPEMTPRQEIRPVPYALSLKPGAVIQNNDAKEVLDLRSNSEGEWAGYALKVMTTGGDNSGVFVQTDGTNSRGIDIQTFNVSSDGLLVHTSGHHSHGLSIVTTGKYSRGVIAQTSSDYADGLSSSTQGLYAEGVTVTTTGAYSNGVDAFTTNTHSKGVNVTTTGFNSNGIDVFTTNSISNGVNVATTGLDSTGVNVTTTAEDSLGVYVRSEGVLSPGVLSETYGDLSPAVSAHAYGFTSHGVSASSAQKNGVYAYTGRPDHMYGVYTPDYIYAKGSQYPAVDVAEYMPITGDAEPGTVLIIAEDGMLEPSATAYDTRVAGIVSTDPAVFLGAKDTGNPGEAPIAVAGRVPCKVDAGYGAIHAGDLLTTSDTPGYAMKAVPDVINGHKYYPDGTLLGKAMGTLESGTGTIEVLVTLQ
jgi:hypothetical protein